MLKNAERSYQLDNDWYKFDDEHYRLLGYWYKNITLRVSKRISGEWDKVQQKEHELKIAKEVRLPFETIQKLEQELKEIKEEKENE